MRELRRLAWAAVFAGATAGPGFAQQIGGATGGTLGTGGTFGGTAISGSTTGGTAAGASGAGTGAGANALGTTTLVTVEQAPQIRAPSTYTTGSAASRAVNATNFLAPTFANPYYQGTLVNARNASINPGGFGTPLGGTTTGTTGTTGAGFGTTGAGGLGRTGAGGGGLPPEAGGVFVQMPRQIAYPAQVRFAAPAVAPVRLQTDLRGVIDRTPMLANPAGVQVDVSGNAVVLRGSVRDEDEARLVEGVVRLTPGVGAIKNELAYPRP